MPDEGSNHSVRNQQLIEETVRAIHNKGDCDVY